MDMHFKCSNLQQLKERYSQIWLSAREDLARGQIESDFIPVEGSRRWGVSAVIRPDTKTAQRLMEVTDILSGIVGDKHFVYNTANLHTTLRSIEFRRSNVLDTDCNVCEYANILTEIAQRYPSIKIEYIGLTASKTTVFAQGYPIDDTIQNIRRNFHEQLKKSELLDGPEKEQMRQTSHISMIVFLQTIKDTAALVKLIEENRITNYGLCFAESIDIVYYEFINQSFKMRILKTIPLRG